MKTGQHFLMIKTDKIRKNYLVPISLVVMIHCFGHYLKINYLEIPFTNEKALKFISNKFQRHLTLVHLFIFKDHFATMTMFSDNVLSFLSDLVCNFLSNFVRNLTQKSFDKLEVTNE